MIRRMDIEAMSVRNGQPKPIQRDLQGPQPAMYLRTTTGGVRARRDIRRVCAAVLGQGLTSVGGACLARAQPAVIGTPGQPTYFSVTPSPPRNAASARYCCAVKLVNAGIGEPGVAQVGHWVCSTNQFLPLYTGPVTPGSGTGSVPM